MSLSKSPQAAAIVCERVVKDFRLTSGGRVSLKETLVRRLKGEHQQRHYRALDDVNLVVPHGETLGIIGANGSGKSTLFRIISQVLRPTAGRVVVDGRISALIELTAGFHPELTGVENTYLNAAIFGFTRVATNQRLPAIEAFAELGDHFRQPIRTYSSGMLARLAFAVAVHVDATILLVDEVLAVGDAVFQKRCLDRLHDLKRQGTTIVLVSHNLPLVADNCDRVAWLKQGRVVSEGKPSQVIQRYLDSVNRREQTPS